MDQTSAAPPPSVGALQAAGVLIALVPIMGAFIALGTAIGLTDYLFAGFVFILYWTGIKAMAPGEFVPALAGSLGGLALAWLLRALPPAWGLPGLGLALAGVLLSIYLLIRGQAAAVINYAFMLLLTLGTCVAFKRDADYAAAAAAIVMAALYSGGLLLIGKLIAARTRKAPDE